MKAGDISTNGPKSPSKKIQQTSHHLSKNSMMNNVAYYTIRNVEIYSTENKQ
jgi:hypothetical protein